MGLVYNSPSKYSSFGICLSPATPQEKKMRELIEKDEKELASLVGLCQRCVCGVCGCVNVDGCCMCVCGVWWCGLCVVRWPVGGQEVLCDV